MRYKWERHQYFNAPGLYDCLYLGHGSEIEIAYPSVNHPCTSVRLLENPKTNILLKMDLGTTDPDVAQKQSLELVWDWYQRNLHSAAAHLEDVYKAKQALYSEPEVTELDLKLTVDEVYALQGCIIGLQGLTASVCNDYRVDNMELLNKLARITKEYEQAKYGDPKEE